MNQYYSTLQKKEHNMNDLQHNMNDLLVVLEEMIHRLNTVMPEGLNRKE